MPEAQPPKTVFDFLAECGRLPNLDDDPKPWTYRGWCLPYIQVTPRWDYWFKIVMNNKLPDEPIPQVRFSAPDPSVHNSIRKWIQTIGHDVGGWSDFRVFVEWLGFALGTWITLPDLKPATHEKLYREVNLGPMIETPYDYLGAIVSEHKANGWNPTAFYPTPHPVCELMAAMNFSEAAPEGREIPERSPSWSPAWERDACCSMPQTTV